LLSHTEEEAVVMLEEEAVVMLEVAAEEEVDMHNHVRSRSRNQCPNHVEEGMLEAAVVEEGEVATLNISLNLNPSHNLNRSLEDMQLHQEEEVEDITLESKLLSPVIRAKSMRLQDE